MYPLLVSPASNHQICADYADWMIKNGRTKSWSYTYGGARWECASSPVFGVSVFNATVQHLQQVAQKHPNDFHFDFMTLKLRKVDCKAAEHRPNGSNLIVKAPEAGVAYLFGECTTTFPQKTDAVRDLAFEAVGWCEGESLFWAPCPFVEGSLWVPRTNLAELVTLL